MKYRCKMCGFVYDDDKQKVKFEDLPDDWKCPMCGAPKSLFEPIKEEAAKSVEVEEKKEEIVEGLFAMAYEAGPTTKHISKWDDILLLGGQLARKPLSEDAKVDTSVIVGASAKQPMKCDIPVFVSHMSFGALAGETKEALAKAAKNFNGAVGSGEGGIYEDEINTGVNYIFEYVPNKYSATEENFKRVSAIEIKIGQSAKPGLGGHLPGERVTAEIAKMRGKPEGEDIISPPAFPEIETVSDLKKMVSDLREKSGGKPIGVKIAANDVEADLAWVKDSGADFITIDGRGGGTGMAPKNWKDTAGIPTMYALYRARKYMDANKMKQTLIVTGGFRTAADVVKALSMGADAVAMATGFLNALAADGDFSAEEKATSFIDATMKEIKMMCRAMGISNIADLSTKNLRTVDRDITDFAGIEHV